MMGPAEFVIVANVACWGTAALLMSLFIVTAVLIRRVKNSRE